MTNKKLSMRERGKAVTLPPSSPATQDRPSPAVARSASESDTSVPPPAKSTSPAPFRPPLAGSNAPGSVSRVFTGVGRQMAEGNQSLTRELADVREKLASYEGSIPLRLLDPARIRRSKYANRHPSEWSTADFQRLKQQLVESGVNVQPIKVRPVVGDPAHDFEVAFGHRRHQGALEAGISVLAFIEEMSDQELWLVMARENLERKNMSPWEQGRSLLQAMETGLFASNRKLSSELGIDQSNTLKLLALARLPDAVVEAFASPTELQMLWAKPLSDALQKDPEGVLVRALAESKRSPRRSAKAVLESLLATPAPLKPVTLKQGSKVVAVIKQKGKEGLSITLPRFNDMAAAEEAIRRLTGAEKKG